MRFLVEIEFWTEMLIWVEVNEIEGNCMAFLHLTIKKAPSYSGISKVFFFFLDLKISSAFAASGEVS